MDFGGKLSVGLLFSFCLTSAVIAGTNEAGLKFLAENKNKEGVTELASGLQYKILRRGNGVFHPTVDSSCSCHYHGTLVDGTVFDSSVDRGQPIDFAPNQVIKGWTEAMQLMVEGDKWELYIPSELAYGDRGSGKIKGGDALIFTIEILKINGDKVPALTCDPETKDGCNDKELKFIEKQEGKSTDDTTKEIDRLVAMSQKKMSPDLLEWVERRLNILRRKNEKKDEL